MFGARYSESITWTDYQPVADTRFGQNVARMVRINLDPFAKPADGGIQLGYLTRVVLIVFLLEHLFHQLSSRTCVARLCKEDAKKIITVSAKSDARTVNPNRTACLVELNAILLQGCSGGDSFRSPPNQLVCHRGCKKHVGKASKFARQQRLGRVEVRKPPQGLEQNSEVIFIPVALMLPRSQPSNS